MVHNYYENVHDYRNNNSRTSPRKNIWSAIRIENEKNNQLAHRPGIQKSISVLDVMMSSCTLNDVMEEFRMNGVDSPYDPDDVIFNRKPDVLSGMGPSSAYLRQKSWPEPERTPVQRLRPHWTPPAQQVNPVPNNENDLAFKSPVLLNDEQTRVINSLPDSVLYSLLRHLEKGRVDTSTKEKPKDMECRFCKNNGERESYYRSHCLKDRSGRVTCPVLRVFVCKRCGAQGDAAHTIKYCPLSSTEERFKSTAIMRSMRMASGRRRSQTLAPSVDNGEHYVIFGETTPSIEHGIKVYSSCPPLNPLWAALEKRLSM